MVRPDIQAESRHYIATWVTTVIQPGPVELLDEGLECKGYALVVSRGSKNAVVTYAGALSKDGKYSTIRWVSYLFYSDLDFMFYLSSNSCF
jgi:hypothetical protein